MERAEPVCPLPEPPCASSRLQGSHGGMTTTSNVTHRVSREEDGVKLTCEAFSKGTHLSKSQTDTLVVYCEFEKVSLLRKV